MSRKLPGNLVQVAGIRDSEEASRIAASGVDLLGWPFRLSVHQEDLSEEEAARIIRDQQLGDRSVLITYLQRADEVHRLADDLGCRWVQLHGGFSTHEYHELHGLDPQLGLIHALVIGSAPLDGLQHEMREREPLVDAWITDSLDPETGARGATGVCHDWSASRLLRTSTRRPLILAGGLTPSNVAAAIREVGPAGVDVHTGIEDEAGAKNTQLLEAFIDNARNAFAGERM